MTITETGSTLPGTTAAPTSAVVVDGPADDLESDQPTSDETPEAADAAPVATATPRARRTRWLRSAVLGAGGAITSVGSLVIGVAAATPSRDTAIAAGLLGRVAGASSAAVSEAAAVGARGDRGRPTSGLPPMQAAGVVAASFALFAAIPIVMLFVTSSAARVPGVAAISLVSLAALAAFGARLGHVSLGRAILRLTLGGALAMALTGAVGVLVGLALG
ncbi:MAG: hypothetical protein U1F43_26085 [Myxococcota bacterium]